MTEPVCGRCGHAANAHRADGEERRECCGEWCGCSQYDAFAARRMVYRDLVGELVFHDGEGG